MAVKASQHVIRTNQVLMRTCDCWISIYPILRKFSVSNLFKLL